jgi:hypothetical protein
MGSARLSAEQVVSGVIEPDEQILWTGRPDADAMAAGERRRWMLRLLLWPPLVAGAAWMAARASPAVMEGAPSLDLLLEPRVRLSVIGLLIGIGALGVAGRMRFRRYARSLAYALTDRRLLILEGSEITDDYPPQRLGRMRLRRRGRGLADVVFGVRGASRGGTMRSRDPVQRERNMVAFKALPDADDVLSRIDAWLAGKLRAAEAEVSSFGGVAGESAGDVSRSMRHASTAAGNATDDTGGASAGTDGARRISHASLGLVVDLPEPWRVRVRNKKKPYGVTFFDREHWHALGEPVEWNVVHGEGPLGCSVEVEVFETKETVSFESLANSRLADAVSGRVVATEPALEIDGLAGFSVTRRSDLRLDTDSAATFAAVVMLQRRTVLREGSRQLFVRSIWPEESEVLERAVDRVVRSIRLL